MHIRILFYYMAAVSKDLFLDTNTIEFSKSNELSM